MPEAQGVGAERFFSSNRLLDALREEVGDSLRPHVQRCVLGRGNILQAVETPVSDVYFVESGMISLVKTMRDGRMLEIAAIGCEGMTGMSAVLGGLDDAIL